MEMAVKVTSRRKLKEAEHREGGEGSGQHSLRVVARCSLVPD